MIIDTDTKPERQIYVIGAFILNELQESPNRHLKVFEVFENVNQLEPISIQTFFLALDWLFIINAVRDEDNERVALCF